MSQDTKPPGRHKHQPRNRINFETMTLEEEDFEVLLHGWTPDQNDEEEPGCAGARVPRPPCPLDGGTYAEYVPEVEELALVCV